MFSLQLLFLPVARYSRDDEFEYADFFGKNHRFRDIKVKTQ
jgi:hypothetical protein